MSVRGHGPGDHGVGTSTVPPVLYNRLRQCFVSIIYLLELGQDIWTFPVDRCLLDTDQMTEVHQTLKLLCHWIMLQGHEDAVEDDADDDHQVKEWVHDQRVEPRLEPLTAATTGLLQEEVSEGAAWTLVVALTL